MIDRKQPFSYEEFKSIYGKVPRLCVDLVIKDNDKVLLTLRQNNGWEGQWHLPGGTVFYREEVTEAAKRIAKEELDLEIEIEEFIGYLEYFSEEKERGFGYSVSLVFACKPSNDDFKPDNQTDRAEYFEIPPDNTVREQKELLLKLKI